MLRGVNLGPHKRVKMDALRALYESLRLERPRTFIQSGNVLFKTKEQDLVKLSRRIETAIEENCGFHADVIVRTTDQMRKAVAKNPFAERKNIDPSRLAVTFLAADPDAQAREKLLALKTDPEELRLDGREMYTYFPNGMAKPTVSWAVIEKILGMSGTARNLNSVVKMLAMAEEMEGE